MKVTKASLLRPTCHGGKIPHNRQPGSCLTAWGRGQVAAAVGGSSGAFHLSYRFKLVPRRPKSHALTKMEQCVFDLAECLLMCRHLVVRCCRCGHEWWRHLCGSYGPHGGRRRWVRRGRQPRRRCDDGRRRWCGHRAVPTTRPQGEENVLRASPDLRHSRPQPLLCVRGT